MVPMSDIVISTTSPSFNQGGGFMKAATPDGVPVIIIVPGLSVVPRLRNLKIAGISWIKSFVPELCLSLPLTTVFSCRADGSGIAFGDAITGPIGANLSKDFA